MILDAWNSETQETFRHSASKTAPPCFRQARLPSDTLLGIPTILACGSCRTVCGVSASTIADPGNEPLPPSRQRNCGTGRDWHSFTNPGLAGLRMQSWNDPRPGAHYRGKNGEVFSTSSVKRTAAAVRIESFVRGSA